MTDEEITNYRYWLVSQFDLRLVGYPEWGYMYSADNPTAADLYNSLLKLQRKKS